MCDLFFRKKVDNMLQTNKVWNFQKGSSNNDNDDKEQVTEYDMDKLRSTIKQFVREWAIEVNSIVFGLK